MYSRFYPEYLRHSGIKNMRWGVRRYQNLDGSLTPEGKIRYGGSSMSAATVEGKKQYDKDVKNEANIGTQASNMAKSASNAAKVVQGHKPSKVPKQVSEMTDEELRARINRIQLENQYMSLTPNKSQVVAKNVSEILDATGHMIGVAQGATSLVRSIVELKPLISGKPKKAKKSSKSSKTTKTTSAP